MSERANVTDIDQDTMSLEEFARRLGIGLTTAYEQARKNVLPIPAIRIGRQYRFSRRAYDRLLDAGHGAPNTDEAA